MKSILKSTDNAEKLLRLTSDTMILLNKDGTCVDIAVNNTVLWFLKEDKLLGKNIFQLTPPSTHRQIYPEFKKVLTHKVSSTHNYKLTLKDRTYFFKCIMHPYEDMVLCQYRDITERSQRKLQLEKKNYELNEIQKAALIGRWRYESEKACFYYIGHTGIMCSEEEQEIHIEEYITHITSEDRDLFRRWLEEQIQGNSEESIDYRIYFQKQIYYIRLKTFVREKHKNGSTTLEGYIQNITDIQQRRNDINLLTHAISNSSENIFAARQDGTLVFANRRFKQNHDIGSVEDITRLKIYEINSYISSKEDWIKTSASLKKGDDHNLFVIYNPLPLHPEVLAIEGNAYWVTSDEGEDILWGFGRDITLRIRHEQQIKRFSQILDKTIENLPAGIVVKDINNDFKYLYRNRESYNRSITMKEALGKDDFDFYPLEVALEKRQQDIEIATNGVEMHWITEERDQSGKPIYLDKRKMRIESNDFPSFLLSIEWDITEMEQMKRELLIAKEKAETSDQLKSAFLANMSHEIRTPLNAIVGFSRIIAESTDDDERKSYYDIVEANNERLLQLINEILDLSKIEAGMVEFVLSPVRLHPLCKEIHDALKFRCPMGVKLVYEPSDEETVIKGDKNRLFQVLSNLITNAFKFTTNGSISYGYHRKENNIEFHVSDTGIGIEADKLHQVFERFVKVNNFAQGTGLGLSICKTIIERLGGTISVSSEFGKGTTFTFTLPALTSAEDSQDTDTDAEGQTATEATVREEEITEEKDAASGNVASEGAVLEDAASEGIALGNAATEEVTTIKENTKAHNAEKIILVAEDTDSNYILTKAILGRTYRLERAKDGMEAVSMFEELQPNLILMDMKMPNLGGLDATRIIRELSPSVPIIALTAYAYEHDKQAAIEAGCNDFLTKPYTQEVLREAVKRSLTPGPSPKERGEEGVGLL